MFTFDDAPAGGKLSCVTKRAGRCREEVGIERKNSLRLVEVVNRVDWLTESHHRTRSRVVAICRFVLMPFCLGKLGQDFFQLRRDCWRRNRFCEESKTGALFRALFVQGRAHLAEKSSPGANLFSVGNCLVNDLDRKDQELKPGQRCRSRWNRDR